MQTQLIRLQNGDMSRLAPAAQIIRQGGLVAFPTETVYGLGADALNPEACRRIYQAKGRPSDNPLIVHICDIEDAKKYTCIKDEADRSLIFELMRAFMPGPITMILPKSDLIPSQVTAGLDTVAIRFPSHPVAQQLIRLSGCPIAAPSANRSGSPSPTCAEHVINDLDGRVEAIVDGGSCEIGLESTIIMPHNGVIRLLRPGAVTMEQLSKYAEVQLDKAILNKMRADEKPLAPGMKYRHYAPKAPVTIVSGADKAVLKFFEEKLQGENNAVLCFEEQKAFLDSPRVFSLGHKDDGQEQARLLFEMLREADKGNFEAIYAAEPPKDGIGLAVYNRLIKACGFEVIKV